MIIYFVRARSRKEEGSPYAFEILAGLFFIFMLLGSAWEVFMLVFDPIFFGFGFYTMQLIPTINLFGFSLFSGFNGEASVYFLGFVGLGLLCVGIERGSELKSRGAISVIPFALAGATLIFGLLVTYLPWFLFALAAAIVPILFFYIAAVSTDEIRSKSLNIGLGYLLIFAGEALNIHIVYRVVPDWIPLLENILTIPLEFMMPLVSILGSILLLIGLIRYRE
ncbi:MAG: hypothetical protein EAX96_16675 [Candidatus Lokiarchaeota archaeon]|nr:hypothetical protein [Candidatus Lokiarchaeota archaeon]